MALTSHRLQQRIPAQCLSVVCHARPVSSRWALPTLLENVAYKELLIPSAARR